MADPKQAILEDLHSELREIDTRMLDLKSSAMLTSVDTAFAYGEALGQLAKVRALLGRDIDDLKRINP